MIRMTRHTTYTLSCAFTSALNRFGRVSNSWYLTGVRVVCCQQQAVAGELDS